MPKRVTEDEKRVPLNCLVRPETKKWIRAQSASQGEIVDQAIAIMRTPKYLIAGGAMDPIPPKDSVAISPVQRSRNKKQRVEQELAASDLTAQIVEREDIEYGHHDTQPRGEHVANLGWRREPRQKGDKSR